VAEFIWLGNGKFMGHSEKSENGKTKQIEKEKIEKIKKLDFIFWVEMRLRVR
jgi:hypothetical protein